MFKRPLLLAGGVLCAVVVAACANGGPTTGLPQQSSGQSSANTTGVTTLSGGSVTATLPPAGGITGSIVFPGGNGTVTEATSVSAPSGVTALSTVRSGPTLQSAAKSASSRSVQQTAVPANATPVLYLTLSSANGASLSSAPALSLTLPAALPNVIPYLALYSAGAWDAVSTASGNPIPGTANGTSLSVPGGGGGIALLGGQSTYLAVYTVPAPSPSPSPSPAPSASPVNLIQDPNFAAGLSAAQTYTWPATGTGTPPAITSTGWSQCSVTSVSSSVYVPPTISASPAAISSPPAVSTYTPSPGQTPGAVEEPAGTSAPGGTNSPAPTQTTVPTYGSATTAAVFGGLFNSTANYSVGNFGYNGLCQQVAVPSNGATLTAEVWESGNEYPTSYLDLVNMVGVVNGSQSLIGYLYAENLQTKTSPGDTAYRQITVDIPASQYAGSTINLFIGTWAYGSSNGKYYSYWFVDDVDVTAGEPANPSTTSKVRASATVRK